MSTRVVAATLLLASALASSIGCASTARLVAADGSHRLVARDSGSGITVVLTTESWAGDSFYADDFVIVHVLIANMGANPVLIAPGDFQMKDGRGFRYTLFDAGGAFQAIPADADPSAWTNRPVPYDPGQSEAFEPIRTDDGELGRLALPWGVLLPGTQMRGFLYFDDVRASANEATLVWRAETPDHRPVGEFGFALHVARF